jgi:hypothetical protein
MLYWCRSRRFHLGGRSMTELIWDGKYDKDGRRVAPVRIPLPFQTIETLTLRRG